MKNCMKLIFISFLLVSTGLFAQSVDAIIQNVGPAADEDDYNNLSAKQSYVGELTRILSEELTVRSKDNASYSPLFKSSYDQLPLVKSDINNYSSKDLGKGAYFTFESGKQFDQFKSFSTVYNLIIEQENIRKALILTGNLEQNRRMLKEELSSAVTFFNQAQFRTAKEFLNAIIRDYSASFTQMDDIYFFRAESFFALKSYQSALQDYNSVITKYSGASSFTSQAIYKSLFIKYVYGKGEEVSSDWDKFKNYVTQKDNFYFKTQILLAVINHQRGDFGKSVSFLENYPPDESGYILSQYIVGNSWANEDSVDQAIYAYSKIEQTTVWPWEANSVKYLKTSSGLQLGYLYYLKGIKTIHLSNVEYDNISANRLSDKAQDYFNTAKSYFGSISKKHPEYASSVLASAWIDLQNAKFNDATLKVRGYINNVSDRDVIYQAVFLDGYVKQKKNPGDPVESQDSYYYVINGMIANQFLTDFLSNRQIISRQAIKTRDFIDSRNLPQASIDVANSLLETIELILSKVTVSKNLKFTNENRVLDETNLASLVDDMSALKKKKEGVRSKGLRELIITADSAAIALKSIIDNPRAEAINSNDILFAEHTPLLFQTSQASLMNSYKDYRTVATSEYKRIINDYKSVDNALKVSKDVGKIPILAYFKDQLMISAEKFNALEVVLYERDYYAQQTEVERWGDAAGYGLSALLFQELERRKRENFEFSTTKGIIKKAIGLKAAQMDKYLSDLAKIDAQEKFINKIDSVNKDFREKLVDYRSVYFNPISKKDFPKDLLDQTKTNAAEKPVDSSEAAASAKKPKKGSKTGANDNINVKKAVKKK